jgi:hypothetical protein
MAEVLRIFPSTIAAVDLTTGASSLSAASMAATAHYE